ncbi:hypothetical protein MKK67_28050 [Methylobacterium sp. J-072]|uniref:hypothetical protein n=1 Tax=Methylobacterium sp. J-072 TaxID=2836651 RepID=UPI001FB871BA|nr:hypothetical protein [Methylobacterium sp. J-072]MCJ2096325.1 hypothetical protein [Methylobacterium sp. J-072]
MRDIDGGSGQVVRHPVVDLRFWVAPEDGPAYEVDLTEFAHGGRREDQDPQRRARWAGDFAGRPDLARQLATLYRVTRPTAVTSKSARSVLRSFFRFLDTDAAGEVSDVRELTDGHGPAFKRWLAAANLRDDTYGQAKTLVDRMRSLEAAPTLFWPTRDRNVPTLQDDVDLLGMRHLFNALKHEGRSIKRMFAEGERLASVGEDPRGSSHRQGFSPAAWHRRENHAWLVAQFTRECLIPKAAFLAAGGQGLHKANDLSQKHDGPAYLAPGMTERGREGIVGKLRWFHPSYHDTAVFLWLFMLGTGWNLSTALGIDVTDDGSWFEDHPHKPEFKVLHAFKGRSYRHVFALSLERPEWHPFNVVRFMIERTVPLRATLRRRLAVAEAANSDVPSHAGEAEIERLRAAIRSPWLYHVVNKVGDVNAFGHEDSASLNNVARLVAERGGLMAAHPSLTRMSTSVARDAWIGYAYAKTGHNVLLAQLAAQHANARTLRHYLKRRRYRNHSEKVVRLVQDAAFAEIEAKRPLDPTRLRIMVRNGEITPEQERRLIDHRQRTRLGMGCLDPTSPPRDVAPEHRQGSLCRVQRCTGCVHGVTFAESLAPLARARAELMHLQREVPFAAWAGSSFEIEMQSIDATLTSFEQGAVEYETQAWLAKLRSGEVIAHDTYPSY